MAFPTIPTVAGGRILFTLNTAGGATKTFPNLSSLTKSAGDLLIAICIEYDGNSTNAEFSSWGGGFTEFADQAGTATMAIGAAYKWSTGSETGTFTVTTADTSANDSCMILMAIPGAHASTPPEAGTMATGTAPDVGALNPSGWDAEDTLWIAVGASGEVSTTGSYTGIGTAPTNYSDQADSGISADAAGGVEGSVAFRQLNAASEDPGAWSMDTSNARGAALLIAVRPVELVTESPTPGGALAGGAGPTASATAASGGAIAGGNEPPFAGFIDSATSGGALAAGTAPSAALVEAASGGALAEGVAPGVLVPSTRGEAIAGGNAPAEVIGGGGVSETPTPGGAVADGTAPTARTTADAGGAAAAGTAPSGVVISVEIGGALAGGFAPTDGGAVTETPTPGGALAGGLGPAASVTFTISGAPAGGTEPGTASTLTPGGALAQGVEQSSIFTSLTIGGALAGGNAPNAIEGQIAFNTEAFDSPSPSLGQIGGTTSSLGPESSPRQASFDPPTPIGGGN